MPVTSSLQAKAGASEGQVGEWPFSDSGRCKGRDRGGGRGPCPERLARARRERSDRRDGRPRRRLGRAGPTPKPLGVKMPPPDRRCPLAGPGRGGVGDRGRGESGPDGRPGGGAPYGPAEDPPPGGAGSIELPLRQ